MSTKTQRAAKLRHACACGIALTLSLIFSLAPRVRAQSDNEDERPNDNIGHRHHHHRHNKPHPTTRDAKRFLTSRTGAPLDLPTEEDAFFFVIFGDRTGGPAEGVRILADAVRDTNLLEPDLVMTVGDLIEGYNQTDEWMAQMTEFKQIMDRLLCPWFPVAGNHDIYWRGPEKPEGEHEDSYETHFGPLWYAFEHKNCWFIVLYSDEGNLQTGEKRFRDPDCQRMSPEQLSWLESTLKKTTDADHVFVFLHHPRWLKGGYGDDWDRVHDLLKTAGNVSAVFAGHIHHMRYEGIRDGIEYTTLATVGGHQWAKIPDAGQLHQFHIVTVRPEQIAIASVPVGEVMDVREITPELINACDRVAESTPDFADPLIVSGNGQFDGELEITWTNPADRPVDVTFMPTSRDSRWQFLPDHRHATVAPGRSKTFTYCAARLEHSIDRAYEPPELIVNMDYLAPGARYSIPERRLEIPTDIRIPAPPRPAAEHALVLDGRDDYARVDSTAVKIPDGPLTLECWFKAESLVPRIGLTTKTENSEYGLFLMAGVPHFSIHIAGGYLELRGGVDPIPTDTWYHVAGVYDGHEARLYVNGQLAAKQQREGKRRTNNLPLLIGADVDGKGNAMSHFHGVIDAVRLSRTARYSDTFTPQRRLTADADTALLLNMDAVVGPWLFDESPARAHPKILGGPTVENVGECAASQPQPTMEPATR